jgi:hypothetical protein
MIIKLLKFLFLVLISAYLFYRVSNPQNYDLLDNVNLIIHESGHLLFAFFGEFISFAGGTIMQLFVPIIFIIYFLRKDLYSASIVSFWLAHSLINVAVYANDAIEMNLPLLGGGIHDWHYMLSELHMLKSASLVSSVFIFFALTITIIAFFFGTISVKYNRKNLFA